MLRHIRRKKTIKHKHIKKGGYQYHTKKMTRRKHMR
jgi:hypothetical protein